MRNNFFPKNNISCISFRDLYKNQRMISSFKSTSDKHSWDEKAELFNDEKRHDLYMNNFISRVDFDGCASLLDFACGSGLLAKRASDFMEQIHLADFSSQMLKFAKQNCPKAEIYEVDFTQIDILPKCDLVFASRCLMVDDLYEALNDLLDKTNVRLYFTVKKDGGFLSKTIIDTLDSGIVLAPDYIYAANILYELGYDFSLDIIQAYNPQCETFDEFKEAILKYKTLNEAELLRLEKLYFQKGVKSVVDYSWAMFCVEKNSKK